MKSEEEKSGPSLVAAEQCPAETRALEMKRPGLMGLCPYETEGAMKKWTFVAVLLLAATVLGGTVLREPTANAARVVSANIIMHPSSNRVRIGSPFVLAAFLGSMFAVRGDAASGPIGAIEADRARIQRHLADVERELRARDVSDMPEDPRRARAANLDRLHEYWVKGVFPHNDSFVGRRVPFFIDAEGRACAVAYLALESGGTEAAHDVAAGMNNARVHDMTSPALAQWLARSGLTLEEAARIQPDYCACPDIESPVCGGDGNTYYNECVARVCGGLTVSCCGACPGNPTPVLWPDCVCPDVSNCVGCDCPLGATTTIECPTSTTST